MNPHALGFLIGIAFGYILQRSGVCGYGCISDALTLRNMKAVQVMGLAIAVGMLGAYVVFPSGWIHWGIKDTYVFGNVLGGLIFGVGFAIGGLCPGTTLSAIGAGNRDGWWTAAGGLLGAVAYSLAYEPLRPYVHAPLNFGKLTLWQWLGTSPTWTALVVALGLIGVLALISARAPGGVSGGETCPLPAEPAGREGDRQRVPAGRAPIK